MRDSGRAEPLMWVKPLRLFLAASLLMLGTLYARAAEPLSAASVMQRGEARFRSLRDYERMVDVESKLGKRVEAGACHFWFKQPRMLRAKILRGSRKGSQVAVDTNGQVRGSKGGILGLIVRRMKTTDSRLLTIRGTSLMTFDWGSFFLKYRAGALRPGAQVVLAPHPNPGSPFEVVLTYPDLGRSVREVYSVDPHRWVIVEGAVYEDQTRVEHVVFRDIKLDTGIGEEWFRL
jgi:hypothetical protein